jgi:hypothetical protein
LNRARRSAYQYYDLETRRYRSATVARQVPQSAGTKKASGGGTVPFPIASLRRVRQAFDTGNMSPGQSASAIEIPAAGGFLRFIELAMTGVTSANAATVVFSADAPGNALTFIEFLPPSGDPPIVPHTGYQLLLWNKYGVFSQTPPYSDPRRDPQYSITPGAGATGGSFAVTLRLPFEIDGASGFCAITNSAANKSYLLNLTWNTTAGLYTTAPTNPPALRCVGWMYYWDEPASQTRQGTNQATGPLGLGSFSQLRIDQPPITAGDKYIKVNNAGPVLRMLLLTLRSSTSSRSGVAAGDIPALWDFVFNTRDRWLISDSQLQSDMAEYFGYQVPFGTSAETNQAAVQDAAGNLDVSVRAFPYFFTDPILGHTTPRSQFQVTADATLTQVRGTSFGATVATMEILTNLIRPASAAALYPSNRIT